MSSVSLKTLTWKAHVNGRSNVIWLPENQTIKVQSTSYYHAILASWWTILGQFSGLDTSSPQPPDWTIYPKKSNFNPLAGIFAHFWRDSFFSQPFCGEHFVYCQPPDWDIWYNLTFTTFLGWTQEQRLHFSGLWVWCPPLKKHAHWNASINFFFKSQNYICTWVKKFKVTKKTDIDTELPENKLNWLILRLK